MEPLYTQDLAYIHATGFSGLACGSAAEIVRLLQSAPIPIRQVVDVGCGAGPLTAALVEAGFAVTGIDASADLVAMARAAVPGASFLHASAYDIELPPCQAIVALGEALTYHAEGADADGLVHGFLEHASEILPAGGMLIFDVIELGEASLSGRFWSAGEDWAVLVETQEDQEARLLVRKIETFRRVDSLYRRGREVHKVRLFDTRILLQQLSARGFETRTAQGYGRQRLGLRRRAFFCTRQG